MCAAARAALYGRRDRDREGPSHGDRRPGRSRLVRLGLGGTPSQTGPGHPSQPPASHSHPGRDHRCRRVLLPKQCPDSNLLPNQVRVQPHSQPGPAPLPEPESRQSGRLGLGSLRPPRPGRAARLGLPFTVTSRPVTVSEARGSVRRRASPRPGQHPSCQCKSDSEARRSRHSGCQCQPGD